MNFPSASVAARASSPTAAQYTERKGLKRQDAIQKLLDLYGPHRDQAAVDAEIEAVVDPALASARRNEIVNPF